MPLAYHKGVLLIGERSLDMLASRKRVSQVAWGLVMVSKEAQREVRGVSLLDRWMHDRVF